MSVVQTELQTRNSYQESKPQLNRFLNKSVVSEGTTSRSSYQQVYLIHFRNDII